MDIMREIKYVIFLICVIATAAVFYPRIEHETNVPVSDTYITVASAPQEIIEKRTYTQKVFDNDDGTFTLQAHGKHIHHKENGELVDSVIEFEDKGGYYEMSQHNYRLRVRKDFGANGLIQYQNVFEGANHTIIYEPRMLAWVNKTDLSDYQIFRNQQNVQGVLAGDDNNVIHFEDAFGDGIHFEVTLMRSGFTKEIVIERRNALELPPTPEHKLVALFEYRGDGLKVIRQSDNSEWNKDDYQDSLYGYTLKEATSSAQSIIRPAYIYDVSDDPLIDKEQIRVFWKKHNGKLFQAKVLPTQFLKDATYPVRADTTTSYYSDSSDGSVQARGGVGDWDTPHDATTGTKMDAGVNRGYIGGAYLSWIAKYEVERAFHTYDTSGLGASAIITEANLIFQVDNFGVSSLVLGLYESTQASPTALGLSDYTAFGTTLLAPTVTVDTVQIDYTFELNASGLSHINKTGYTMFATREYTHDVLDSRPTTNVRLNMYMSEDVTYNPYLEITYTTGGGGTTPILDDGIIWFK
jgi:hypothetical protein